MRLLPLQMLIALALLAPSARAVPEFPDEIAVHLELDAAPVCQLCHTDGGSGGTANQPFAASMKAAGLIAYDSDSLIAALDQLEADGTDSDDDGVGDIDELRAGTDPNQAGGEPIPPLQYGFGCAAGPEVGVWGALALALRARARRRGRVPSGSVLTTARTSANSERP